jgi:hypothetical protein
MTHVTSRHGTARRGTARHVTNRLENTATRGVRCAACADSRRHVAAVCSACQIHAIKTCHLKSQPARRHARAPGAPELSCRGATTARGDCASERTARERPRVKKRATTRLRRFRRDTSTRLPSPSLSPFSPHLLTVGVCARGVRAWCVRACVRACPMRVVRVCRLSCATHHCVRVSLQPKLALHRLPR